MARCAQALVRTLPARCFGGDESWMPPAFQRQAGGSRRSRSCLPASGRSCRCRRSRSTSSIRPMVATRRCGTSRSTQATPSSSHYPVRRVVARISRSGGALEVSLLSASRPRTSGRCARSSSTAPARSCRTTPESRIGCWRTTRGRSPCMANTSTRRPVQEALPDRPGERVFQAHGQQNVPFPFGYNWRTRGNSFVIVARRA